MDIRNYAISGNYQVLSPTELRLEHTGQSVTLRGPITIYIGTKIGLELQEETITIGAGKTRMFGPLAALQDLIVVRLLSVDGTSTAQGTTTTQTSQTTQTTQTTANYGLDLLLGASGEQILGYIKGNAKDQGYDEIAGETALAAEAAFTQAMTQAITEAGGTGADLPNLADAAQTFGLITHLILVKDAAGKPLFPLLHTTGIQKLLARMTKAAAVNDHNLTALKSLVSLLAGLDMARYKPATAP